MKYILKKDLPLAPKGTEVVVVNNSIIYGVDNDNVLAEIRQDLIPEWLEEVKEAKTIFDLTIGDDYWKLFEDGSIEDYKILGRNRFNSKDTLYRFKTEREAKRNKLLRQLATRTDKWLPNDGEIYYSYWRTAVTDWAWSKDNEDYIRYHMGLVFRNEEEYNRWMTEENRDLLFNI